MKIVVTGGLGKLGTWVVRDLVAGSGDRDAHEVTVFDRVAAHPDRAVPGVRYVTGDIEDLGQVVGVLAGADAAAHLAAVRNPRFTTNDVTYRTNVIGTFNVHEAAYRLGVCRVVSAGSQDILGWGYRQRDFEPDYLPVDEDHPVRPQDAYGVSKEAGEAIARAYARKGLETIVLRPNRVMTPDELHLLRDDGGTRPDRFLLYSYVDVRDCAAAFRLALERPIPSGTVLFIVADDTASAEPLAEALPRYLPAVTEMARHLTGTRAAISNARAKQVLGWQPRYSWRAPG
jgi:nucleoside-diphosphate-sugar epimerase